MTSIDEPGSGAAGRRTPLLLLALVLGATFATYAVCLGHFFFMDDFWHLEYAWETPLKDIWRPWVYSGEDEKAYWFAAGRSNVSGTEAFFRPLVSLLFASGLRTWGASAAAFHAISLGAHLAATAAVFWLAWRLFRRPWLTAFSAAVFGLHPGQYEAVEWIAANADALLALTGILCVAAFVEAERRRPEGRGFYVLSLVSFLLALGSKEMAVTIPLVLLGYQLFFSEEGWRETLRTSWRRHALFWMLLLAYLLWRLPTFARVYSLHPGGNYISDIHSSLFVAQVTLNFTYYLLNFLLPLPIFPISFREILGNHCWWVAALCVAVMALVVRALVRGAGEERRALRFGAFWVGVTILPFSFVDPAQRLVHFPAAGFALAAGGLVAFLWRTASPRLRTCHPAAALSLLALYSAASFTYASALGFASNRVRTIARGLDREIATLPPGAEIYLVDLWQPAWMFEHLFAVTRPERRDHIHVLTFDPEVVPADLRDDFRLLRRWFTAQFGDVVDAPPVAVRWDSPRSLMLRRQGKGYLTGLVDKILDFAPEAADTRQEIDAGAFVARALRSGPEGVTEISFRWKEELRGTTRSFYRWTGDHWERLAPPPGWDSGAGPFALIPAQ
jgi:hypothetical protein